MTAQKVFRLCKELEEGMDYGDTRDALDALNREDALEVATAMMAFQSTLACRVEGFLIDLAGEEEEEPAPAEEGGAT